MSPGVSGEGAGALFIAIALLTVAATVPAATLPLGGVYRSDRFMPVCLTPGETSLVGDGVVPTDATAAMSETVVPLLIGGSPEQIRCGSASLPLRPARSDEKLVASTGDALQAGAALFPGAVIDPIALDPADLLPGPPAAWEALDAVVLDAATMRRVDDAARATLLADGVLLACPGPVPPDLAWPWRREGARWVLRHEPAGPAGLIDDAAYVPTTRWTPQPPAGLRRTAGLLGVLLMLVSVSLTLLLPRRWALPTVVALAAVATVGLLHWRTTLGTLDQAGGDLFILRGDGLIQRDIWLYQHARDDTTATLPWAGDTTPVFDSARALAQANLRLHVDAAGALRFTYIVPEGHTLAFRRRLVTRTLPAAPNAAGRESPMQDLARAEYLGPGLHVAGEIPAPPGRWNSVLLAPQTSSPR